jgi:hypothetical protein
MFGNNNSPSWIKSLPELDRTAVSNLLKTSKVAIDKPREMHHVFYDFQDDDKIQGATDQLSRAGWQVDLRNDPENPTMKRLEAMKRDYVLDEANYVSDRAFFNRLADMYDVHYDGWYAT